MRLIDYSSDKSQKTIKVVLTATLTLACIFVGSAILVIRFGNPFGNDSVAASEPSLPEVAATSKISWTKQEWVVPNSSDATNRLRFDRIDNVNWFPLAPGSPTNFTATRSVGFGNTEETRDFNAALAAFHIVMRASPYNVGGYEGTIQDQVRGLGKAILLSETKEQAAEVDVAALESRSFTQAPAGWTIDFSTPTAVDLTLYWLVSEPGGSTLKLQPVRMFWDQDHWELVISDSGQIDEGLVEAEDRRPDIFFAEVFQI